MLKKLLLLLVFSATTFASAQTMTVVELISSDGRGTFGPHAFHAIQGDDLSPYVYDGYTTSVTTYTLIDGVLTTPDGEYSSVGLFERESRDFIYNLGLTGRFFNATTSEPLQGVRLSSYHREPLFDNLEAHPDWSRYEEAPSYFIRRDCGFVFLVAEIAPLNGYNQFLLSRNTDAGDSYELIIARNFGLGYPGTYFRTDADVIEAVDRLLVDSGCGCTSTSDSAVSIDSLIREAEPNYEYQGNGSWLDRDIRPNGFAAATWNTIEIDEDTNTFILEVEAGGDGRTGTRTSYDCLEELLDNLPQ